MSPFGAVAARHQHPSTVAYNVEKLAVADPALGREELRKMFDQGHIALLPQPDTMQSGMASVIKRLVRSSAPGLR